MDDIATGWLFAILIFLILLSAFFSGSETGMMSINRYRLRHLAKEKNALALRVDKLLSRVDRLLGVILIGNTFANIFASAIATILAIRLYPEYGVSVATILLTLVVLIFSEITPKTLAALHPQRVSFFAAWPLSILLYLFYPVIWVINTISNGLLRLFRISTKNTALDRLTSEELRTVVLESTGRIAEQHQEMLLRILELEEMTVDDVMVPRNEIVGIELDQEWNEILAILMNCPHTRLPVYKDGIDNVQGIINSKDILRLLGRGKLDEETLLQHTREAYYIPEGTPLATQMLNFRKEQLRVALVVDEYGDIQGLVTIEDIIEEIVGELTTAVPTVSQLIGANDDGSFMVDGSASIRELNRLLEWQLPVAGPKTLSGFYVEYLESIPNPGTCMLLNHYPVEVVAVEDNLVKSALVFPQLIQGEELPTEEE